MRIQSGKCCYFALQRIMKSKIVYRKTKISIYHSIIRYMRAKRQPWQSKKKTDEEQQKEKSFGVYRDKNETQNSTGSETTEDWKPYIFKVVKAERLRWAGYIKKQNDKRVMKLVESRFQPAEDHLEDPWYCQCRACAYDGQRPMEASRWSQLRPARGCKNYEDRERERDGLIII